MNNKYIIVTIIAQNGKHNFYHDEMLNSIAEIVSIDIGECASIKYIPEYDCCYHYVTTTAVQSIEEHNGSLVITTKNTTYVLHAIAEAEFTSVWDGGFAITTDCKVDTVTNEVFGIEVSVETADMVNELDEEYITINGKTYPVVSNEYMESDPEEKGGYWYRQ